VDSGEDKGRDEEGFKASEEGKVANYSV